MVPTQLCLPVGFRHAASVPSGPVPADARPPAAEARRLRPRAGGGRPRRGPRRPPGLRARRAALRHPDAPRPRRRPGLRPRLRGEPHAPRARRRDPRLPHGDARRRDRARALRLRALDELPVRGRARDRRRRDRARGEADRARGLHREARAGALGRGAEPEPDGAEGDLRAAPAPRRGVREDPHRRPRRRDTPDAELDVWAGHLPLVVRALDPVPDPALRPGIPVPDALRDYRRAGLVEP